MIFPRVLLSFAAVQFSVIPLVIDLSDSHVLNASWPPHARFHMVWLLSVGALLALYVWYLVWAPTKTRLANLKHASIVSAVVLVAFHIAAVGSAEYGGALSDPEHQRLVLGIDGNLASFSVASILVAVAATLVWTRSDGAGLQ